MTQTIAQFSVTYQQFMDEQANLLQPLPPAVKNSDTLVNLYKHMLFTRTFDAKAVALQRTGKMGTYPSSLGQEAIYVAIGHVLHKEDLLIPYYRDQATMLMRGVKPEQIFAYWGGDERGSLYSESCKEDFPLAIPIATQFLHAAGAAYAIQLRKEKRAVSVSGGDGSTSEGDFYEAINFAGVFKLPVVFVINNNQWAISVPRPAQSHTATLAQKAIAAGFEGIQVDGNDVIAVADTMAKALDKARNGGGPTLIEAITYRLCDHTTADDAKRYASSADLAKAWTVEPVTRLRRYLEAENLWNEEKEQQWQAACSDKMMQAVEAFLNTPMQPATAIVDYMYEKWPAAWQEQREMLTAENAKLAKI
jgi:2-oxoisovalerate dehydrogenase E1 component alpha subunit